MKFDRLVRDRIPEIMKEKGQNPITHTASQEEYEKKLNERLREEATEFYAAGREEELADVLEVLYAICEVRKIPMSKLEQMRETKNRERGSFSKRIVLDGVQEK